MTNSYIKLLDLFIPSHLMDTYENIQKARTIVGTYLFSCIVFIALKMYTLLGATDNGFPFTLLLLFTFFSLLLFRWKGNFLIWANSLTIILFYNLATLSLETGGLYSDDTLWILTVPLTAFTLSDKYSGAFWSIALLSWFCYLYYLEHTTAVSYLNEVLIFDKGYYFTSIFWLFFCIMAAALLYESQKIKVIKHLKMQQAALALQKEAMSRQTTHLKTVVAAHQKASIQLQNSNQELQQFAYITAHNLREPVANIIGLIALYDKTNPANSFNATIVDSIIESGKNIDGVVRDLHQIISIKKKINAPKETIDIQEVFENICQRIDKKIKESQATINAHFHQPSTIVGIRSYADSIVQNLLTNAIKYRSPDRLPEIQITTQKIDDYLCLSIQDNGLGIDLNKNKNKLFGLYRRFHSHVEGTGLGLYLVKTQIESMEGKITVDSTVDVGSTFKAYFKVA